MVASIGTMVAVWLVCFVGIGNFCDVIPPGRMTPDEYAMRYMMVGAVVCLVGTIAVNMWFSTARSFNGRGKLGTEYRTYMCVPAVAGAIGLGYMMFLGASEATLHYVFTILSGVLVYIIAACIATPAAGRKYPPFG